MWDQDGGFLYDDYGNIAKEWSWQTDRTLRDKIVIQVNRAGTILGQDVLDCCSL